MTIFNYLEIDTMHTMDKLVPINNQIRECVDTVAYELYRKTRWPDIPFDGLDQFPVYKRKLIALMALKEAILAGKSCHYEFLFLDKNTSKIMQLFALLELPLEGDDLKNITREILAETSFSLQENWKHEAYDLINDQLEKMRDSDLNDHYDEEDVDGCSSYIDTVNG